MVLEAFARKHRLSPRGYKEYSPQVNGINLKGNNQMVPKGSLIPKNSPNLASKEPLLVEQKRQLGLCFRYGEKYTPGQQCKRQLLQMERQEEENEEGMVEVEESKDIGRGTAEDGEISMHALQGCPMGKIIKAKGWVGKKKLMILTDSGSTHSFLNEETALDL